MLLGERKAAMVYILLAVVFIIGIFHISLPSYFDLIGSLVILPLYSGQQEFAFTSAFIGGRIAFLVLGILFLIISLRISEIKSRKAE